MQDMPFLEAVQEPDGDRHVEGLDYEALSRADSRPVPVGLGLGLEPVRQVRRLPERLLVAAHQACDLGALEVAANLLSITEVVLLQPQLGSPGAHRRAVEGLVAAHERLWHLRRAGHVDPDPFAGSS